MTDIILPSIIVLEVKNTDQENQDIYEPDSVETEEEKADFK